MTALNTSVKRFCGQITETISEGGHKITSVVQTLIDRDRTPAHLSTIYCSEQMF